MSISKSICSVNSFLQMCALPVLGDSLAAYTAVVTC